mmetsp:Transcript_139258/g.353066  ORF Transcript_139258/g.353066 Transcript_139258/m.353066 type:complete len:391 (-) Transcript_139258:4413-5585(-)
MSLLVQLVSCCQSRRTRPNNCDLLSGPVRRWHGSHPAHLVGFVDDGELHGFDAHRVVNDAEHTSSFTRCRTNSACELREVVRRHQPPPCLMPTPIADELVPFRDEVPKRATGLRGDALVAEWSPAVHASGRLRANLLLILPGKNLPEVLNAVLLGPLWQLGSVQGHESPVIFHHLVKILRHFLRPEALLENGSHVLDVHLASRGCRLLQGQWILAGRPSRLFGCGIAGERREEVVDQRKGRWLPRSLRLLRHLHEIHWEDAGHLARTLRPPSQNSLGHCAACEFVMSLHQLVQILELLRVSAMWAARVDRADIDGRRQAALSEAAIGVPHPKDSAAHACGHIVTHGPEDHDPAASHVLAAVVARALHDRPSPGVADAEALCRDAPHKAHS